MTRYEQGFMSKCAEYGVDEFTAQKLLKAAMPSAANPAFSEATAALQTLLKNRKYTPEQILKGLKKLPKRGLNPVGWYRSIPRPFPHAAVAPASKGKGIFLHAPIKDPAALLEGIRG
jgi:hypothetical protein